MRFVPTPFILVIFAVALVVWIAIDHSADERKRTEYIAFLAADTHMLVGERVLRIPYIALPAYSASRPHFSLNRAWDGVRAKARIEAFRRAAYSRETAPELDKLEIRVRAFGWNDSDPSLHDICSQLADRWAKSVCDDPWAPLIQALPVDGFYLGDSEALAAFDNRFTVGFERVGDQLRSMEIRRGIASVECDSVANSSRTNCTAAMRLDGGLIAVWSVRNGREETPLQMAKREGLAIQSFVEHAISANENFSALLLEVCNLRAPGTVGHPRRPNSGCQQKR